MPEVSLKILTELLRVKMADSPAGTVGLLISETVRFRDRLKHETGRILTIGDTRASVKALENWLNGDTAIPDDLSSDQQTLLQLWLARLTSYRR